MSVIICYKEESINNIDMASEIFIVGREVHD
jgi:hypothetical protein